MTRQTLETLEALIKAVQDPTNALQKRRADAEDLAERAIDAFVEAHSVTKSHAYATCARGGGGELGEIYHGALRVADGAHRAQVAAQGAVDGLASSIG
ncbi:MAG: hypothetical protein AAF865_01465 [Pseudomonadota bacterium]